MSFRCLDFVNEQLILKRNLLKDTPFTCNLETVKVLLLFLRLFVTCTLVFFQSRLYRKNCSEPLTPGVPVPPSERNGTDCDWAPFSKNIVNS